ncbi:MAG: transposase [Saprospiraceae bacterium]|nr:transposase [Saprospiraceae bacterium]
MRGKENKPVEFGAKVHMVQIDGLNFIEHFSYEAFNECTRLTSAIFLVRKYTGKCTHVGADAIYATNKNRSYCSKENIHTSFVRKGKAGTSEDQRSQMQKLLAKDRSTRMEGSFGTEKNHYGLRRIMARTAQTEKLCVFFGVHIANLCRVIDKIPKNISLQQAA